MAVLNGGFISTSSACRGLWIVTLTVSLYPNKQTFAILHSGLFFKPLYANTFTQNKCFFFP